MTEAEWQTSDDLAAMLDTAAPLLTRRKRLLCGVAVCREVKDLLPLRCVRAVLCAEWYADGLATREELMRANIIAESYLDTFEARRREARGVQLSQHQSRSWRYDDFEGVSHVTETDPARREAIQAVEILTDRADLARLFDLYPRPDLLREVVGNPLLPCAFDAAWRTSTAVGVAQAMYDSRDFGALPILADALQDAGCEDAAILDHCRGDGSHVRACWAVDLVLGQR